jgi:hypothetical protein
MWAWNLPPELDDIIIDHLHDDRDSLAKCALVRRSWLPAARHHFWHDVRLTCTKDGLEKMRSMLDTSPAATYHVRNVVLTQKKGEACQWYDLHLLYSAFKIISCFPSLESVTLDGLWFGAPKTASVSSYGIAFPSVHRLCISTCTFDAFDDVEQLCHAFPNVSRLQFDGVWWGRWISDQGFARGVKELSTSAVHLKELDLGSCFSRDKVIDWLLETLSEPSVETLRLPLIGAYDMRLRDLLAFIGPSLRHLEIGSPSSSTVKNRGKLLDRFDRVS